MYGVHLPFGYVLMICIVLYYALPSLMNLP